MQGKVFLKMDDKTKEAWGKQHLLSKAQVEEDQKKTAKASLKGRKHTREKHVLETKEYVIFCLGKKHTVI